MTIGQRLYGMGFRSYSEYLKSNHWYELRRRWVESGRPCRCCVCLCVNYQLHHRTYARIGCESLNDMVPLCRRHHGQLHELLAAAGKGIESTDWALHRMGVPCDETKAMMKPKLSRAEIRARRKCRGCGGARDDVNRPRCNSCLGFGRRGLGVEGNVAV